MPVAVDHVVVRSKYGEWELVLCDTEDEAKAAFKETSYRYACQRYTRSADGDFAPAEKYGWMGQDLGWIRKYLFKKNNMLTPPDGPSHAVIINSDEGYGVVSFGSFDAARTFYNTALSLGVKMGVAQYHRVRAVRAGGHSDRWAQLFRQGRMKLSFEEIEEIFLNKIQPNDGEQANVNIDSDQVPALTAAVDRLQGNAYKDLTNRQAFDFLTMYSKLMGTKNPASGDLILCRSSWGRFHHHAILIKGKGSDPNDDKWRVYEIEKDPRRSKTKRVKRYRLEKWLKNTFKMRHNGKFSYSGILVSSEVSSLTAPEIRSRCEAARRNKSPGDYNLIYGNCEHWTREARFGNPVSLQVLAGAKTVCGIASVVIVAAAGCLPTIMHATMACLYWPVCGTFAASGGMLIWAARAAMKNSPQSLHSSIELSSQ